MPLAENARFQRLESFGGLVVRPAVAGFLSLVALKVPQGKFAIVSFVQALTVNPTTTLLDRVVAGLTWEVQIADLDGKSPQRLAIDPNGGFTRWTFLDGRPAVRNVLVTPAKTLIWGANADPAVMPAAITNLAGGISGFLFDQGAFSEDQLALLLAKP